MCLDFCSYVFLRLCWCVFVPGFRRNDEKGLMIKASRATFIVLLLFAPVAFGSVEPWAFFFLALLTGLSLLFYLVHCQPSDRYFYRIPGFIPLVLIFSLLVFQLIPLPEFLSAVLSPRSLSFRQQTVGLFADTAFWPLSLDVRGGIYELSRFLVCFGCYVLAVQLLADGKAFKRIVLILALFGGALALYSILQSIFTVDRVLWFRGVPENANPFGPYVNRNHYAGLMEMLFPVTLALTFLYRPAPQFGTRREKIIGFFEDDDFLVFILLCLGSVLMALSVFMSLSRGGIFGLCVSLVFFMSIFAWTTSPSRRSGKTRLAVVILFAIVLAVSWFGWDRLDQRFGELEGEIIAASPASRISIVKDGLNMFRDFPVFGAGFGSFRNVFPRYHSAASFHLVDHAHNDYLELLLEGGVSGMLLFALFFLFLFKQTLVTLKKRVEPYAVFVCLGAVSGLAAIFCHSLVDFNLHINANTLYFSFLCALVVSASHTRFRSHITPGTYLSVCRQKTKPVVLVIFFVLWIPLLVFSAGQWAADYYSDPFMDLNISGQTDLDVRQNFASAAQQASRLDPFKAVYRVMAGDAAYASKDYADALQAYQQAIRLVPTRAEFLQRAGWAAYFANNDIDLADALMAAGVDFYPEKPELYGRYAAFLLTVGQHAAAREVIRKGLDLDPQKAKMFFDIMRAGGLSYTEIYAALTDHSYVWYTFATYIRNTDYDYMTREVLVGAVNAAKLEESPSPGVYLTLARLFAREKNHDEAIAVLKKGVDKLPENVGLLYELARQYEMLQITYKAVELYKKIVLLNPGYGRAEQRLRELTSL